MRIFVITGSGGFDALVEKADELAAAKKLDAEVTAQIANGRYIPKNIKWFRFTPRKRIDELEDDADIIISHCGLMSLMENVRAGRKVIGVVNFSRQDYHQADLAKKLSSMGHIIWCQNLDDLPVCIERARTWEPNDYVLPECEIAKEINKILGD